MIQLTEKEVVSTTGAVVHRIGTECYGHGRMTRCMGDTPEMFEEVGAEPAYRKDEYDATVAEMVRERYPIDEECGILRKAIAAAFTPAPLADDADTAAVAERGARAMEEFAAYNAYVEQCKADAPERIAARKAAEAARDAESIDHATADTDE